MNPARRQTLRWLAAMPGASAGARAGAGIAPRSAPAFLALPALGLPRRAEAACRAWPAWEAFAQGFIDANGRVVESSDARRRTVSEAQGYALFFALVANQPTRFEKLLQWTEDNLAGGDLRRNLPAWHWGRRDDGSWGVLDDNAATDADLWIAHTLAEAGRLWGQKRYSELARALAERVLAESTADLPGLGLALLPGPRGFTPAPQRWRLNPSYLAPMQLRGLAHHFGGRWQSVHDTALRVLRESAPRGLAPDWATYDGASRRFLASEPLGSHDAIRVYLWLGLSVGPRGAVPAALRPLLKHFKPMAEIAEAAGFVPEKIDTQSGSASGQGPLGFSAALLPFLRALGRPAAVQHTLQQLRSQPPQADAYYDQVLRLFGQGAQEGRFAFAADGSLRPAWNACRPLPPTPRRDTP